MENSTKLKKLIENALAEKQIRLYELNWTQDHVLQCAIIKDDGTMDLDTCAEASEILSEMLDKNDLISGAYTLEVCSLGAEREIKDLNELNGRDDAYVFIRVTHPVRKMKELTGTVRSFSNGVISLEYRDKAAVRTAEIETENIEFIRYAVKL